VEVTAELFESGTSLVFERAENRVLPVGAIMVVA